MNPTAVNAIITARLNSASIRDFCKQYKIQPLELSELVGMIGKVKQSLKDLTPDFTEPDNLENKTLPELIELLITAAKYWREQAEN